MPVNFIHEDVSKGVIEGGVIDHVMTEVGIKVLPKNLPEGLTVDLTTLEIGQSVHLSEVELPKGCTLQKPITEDYDPVIVSIHAPKVVEEVIDDEVEPEETVEEDAAEELDTQASEE